MKIGACDICNAQDVEISRSELAGMETWSCSDGCPSPDQMAKITDGVAAQIKVRELAEQVGSLKGSIRLIHEREWPAGDKTKGAHHAQKMWDIADAARNRWNF